MKQRERREKCKKAKQSTLTHVRLYLVVFIVLPFHNRIRSRDMSAVPATLPRISFSRSFDSTIFAGDRYSRRELGCMLHKFWLEEYLCDICLVAGEEKIPAHKVVLAAFSPYFEAMFRSGMLEAKDSQVNMKNIDAATLRNLVGYAYGQNITVTKQNLQDVIVAANFLQLEELSKKCEKFLFEKQTDEDNALSILKVLTTLSSSIAARAEQYVKNTFSAIAQTDGFLNLSYEDVKKLLSATDLHTPSEEEVFYAAMRWIDHAPERMEQAPSLLACVRLPLLQEAFLKGNLKRHPTIRQSRRCRDLVNQALEFKLLLLRGITPPSSFPLVPRRCCCCSIFFTGGRQLNEFDEDICSSELLKYDPLVKRFTIMEPMITARAFHAVAEDGRKMYVIGGENDDGCLNSVEFYDLIANEWIEVAPMREKRSEPAAVFLDNKLYVCGGRRSGYKLASVEVYDPVSNQWMAAPSMTEPRSRIVAGVINGYIYVLSTGKRLSAERFSPELQRWEEVEGMTTNQAYVAATFLKGKIYAVRKIHYSFQYIDCFDPREMSWTEVASMARTYFDYPLVVPHMNKIYIIGEPRDGIDTIEVYEDGKGCATHLENLAFPLCARGLVALAPAPH
ncbi:hypothetical protein Y032_0152g2864 [Ancylostoma ceylanicum]|uniref:BTB domain-containing protein n=1 Tax=Ancylostoma ceylanicum TaxID=53326 RepID=A0A016T0V8_9BILA|nr:hypothetical protein Y032_0152g2864 [Ancylostoma ceylanicum]